RVAATRPIEPAPCNRRGRAAVRFVERAAMPDRKIGDRGGYVRDSLVVVHPVFIRDVLGAALDVDHRSVQRLEHFLADADAGHVGRPGVQYAAVVDHQRLHARIFRDLERLNTAAAPTGVGDLRWIDAAQIRAAGAFVLGKGPVNGVGQIRYLRARRWELSLWRSRRGWTRFSRRRTGTTEDAAAGDHEISVRGDLEQVEAAARAVLRTSAVAPRDHAELRVAEARQVLRSIDDVTRERCDFLFHRGEASGGWRVGPVCDVG